MNKFILMTLVAVSSVQAEYKLLTDYQNTLYQLIQDYVATNSTNSSDAVLKFIYSDDTHVVFNDALAAGYSRREVIMGTYQGSFLNHPNKVIIQALHDAVLKENVAHDAAYYGSFVALGIGGLTTLVLSRYFWTYFKYDRRALNYYRANHHRYRVIGGGTATNPTADIDTLRDTNPLVPEVPDPFFQ